MADLKDKVIVVTGASGGMGRVICERLAAEGAALVLGSVDREPLEELAQKLQGKGARVASMVFDATSEGETRAFFKLAEDTFGGADALLNLAGISIPAKVEEMTAERYDLTVDINLKTAFLCSKYFIPLVNAEKGGLIINIGSMAAKRANANAPIYCTAKAAVNMFSQGLALQVKNDNIRVTTLNPGGTDTAFWGDRKVPREKFMQPSDVAEVVLFLLKFDSRIVFHDISFESFLNF